MFDVIFSALSITLFIESFSNFSVAAASGGVVVIESFLGDTVWNCPTGVTSDD